MPTFRILYTAVEYRSAEFEADNEEHAKELFNNDGAGMFMNSERGDDTGEYEIIEVDEV